MIGLIWFIVGLFLGAVIVEVVRYGANWIEWWRRKNAPPERGKMDPLDPNPYDYWYHDIAGTYARMGSVSNTWWDPDLKEWKVK